MKINGKTVQTVVMGAIALIACGGLTSPVWADQPGRGKTAGFEVTYLKFIINHHYGALRMTELAAGTDPNRDPALSEMEGTSPTPGNAMTSPKAASAELKSMARRNNRMQREEIMEAQGFLREWYGIEYQPRLASISRRQIALLEQAPAGERFDHLFMEVLSRHHFLALEPSARCVVASDIAHAMLQRYCFGIVHMQTSDIQNMREMLCQDFQICDYQPIVGLKGRHSGGDGHSHLDSETAVTIE